MRVVEYLSPTSIAKYAEDSKEFYLMYLSDNRPDKFPQTQPMSIGSSFDAHVKSYLHERLFGKGQDARFNFETLFETQVEQHNRDWALPNGRYAFECYKSSGALADLMITLQGASNTPRFEFDLMGSVNGSREAVNLDDGQVILLGKPDCHFVNKDGANVILDWKVNGYCAKSNTSPKKGYVKLRDGWVGTQSRTHNQGHKDAQPMMHHGVMINVAHPLEVVDKGWANQLSIYGWLLGMSVGSDFVVAIDQLACSPGVDKPQIRIAEHRAIVSSSFQEGLYLDAVALWKLCHSDHFFQELSKDDSKALCASLDLVSESLKGNSEEDAWFRAATRGA